MLRLVTASDPISFTADHFWLRHEGEQVRVGLTQHGVDCLRGVTDIHLQKPGGQVELGQSLGWIESVKAVMDLAAPLAGQLVARNEALHASPTLLHDDPLGHGWLYLFTPAVPPVTVTLMDFAAYEEWRADVE